MTTTTMTTQRITKKLNADQLRVMLDETTKARSELCRKRDLTTPVTGQFTMYNHYTKLICKLSRRECKIIDLLKLKAR
jgi:hypothetical protein